MDRIATIADELTTDPLTRGYSGMTDEQVKSSLNAVDRPNDNSIAAIVSYLLNKKHRTNQGGDDTYSPIIGRLYHIARSNEGDDPFGRAGAYGGLDVQHIHACQTYITLFESPHAGSMDFDDTNLPYGYVEASGAWSTTHSTALKALSQNQISRGVEIGVGYVRVGHVTEARAL